MKLTILSCGTYIPEKGKGCSSYLLQNQGKNIVIDFGRGTIERLLRAGIEYHEIGYILITHCHMDHMSELFSLMHLLINPPRDMKKPDITLIGPKGFSDTMDMVFRFFKKSPGRNINIEEYCKQEIAGLTLEGFPVKHSDDGLAYRLTEGDKTICISGDTGECQGIRDAAEQADIAVIEATVPEPKDTHLTGEQAGKIAQDAGVKKLVLTHISPFYGKEAALSDAKKAFAGELIAAEEGMRFLL